MSIPPQFASRYVYHFTHLDNLPSLLRNGFLANNHPDFPSVGSTSIAATSIQERRATMRVPCGGGGVVHDYVPFYFGSLSPMLLGVVNKKNIDQWDILYFEFPISILNRPGAAFTDASANTNVLPRFYDNVQLLGKLNWSEIDSLKWSSGSEALRHQRMAEALVPYAVDVQSASRVIVWNEAARDKVARIVNQFGVPFPPIEYESPARRHYFVKFNPVSERGRSLVTGPKGIAKAYVSACEKIISADQPRLNKPFKGLKELLDGLRENFGCLPHTAELIGLKSENGMHRRTVDIHTAEVVAKLLELEEFKNLPLIARNRVELAAYLHDIGKGPKSRWAWNDGLQKVDADHPVRAMPMMREILINFVSEAKPESVKSVLKLVCYHDLVGEVLGKERDEKQIVDVATDLLELDMLFAIGKADATSLSETWWDQCRANALYERCKTEISTRNLDSGY
jgi:hypothetical protein